MPPRVNVSVIAAPSLPGISESLASDAPATFAVRPTDLPPSLRDHRHEEVGGVLTTDEHGDVARGAVVVTVRVRHRALQVAVVDEQLEPEGLSRRERNATSARARPRAASARQAQVVAARRACGTADTEASARDRACGAMRAASRSPTVPVSLHPAARSARLAPRLRRIAPGERRRRSPPAPPTPTAAAPPAPSARALRPPSARRSPDTATRSLRRRLPGERSFGEVELAPLRLRERPLLLVPPLDLTASSDCEPHRRHAVHRGVVAL